MTAQLVALNKFTPVAVIEATGRAIARQRNEIDDEFAKRDEELESLRAEVAALRQIVDALPSGSQVSTALTASRVLGRRYLGEVRRGLEQLRGVANIMTVNGDDVDQDDHINRIENDVRSGIAEWHLARSLIPSVKLLMADSSKPNLRGGRKLTDHLRISLLRTVEHMLGGNPEEIVVRGREVRMCRTGVALIQRDMYLRAAVKGLRGDYRGNSTTLRLASLSADARLLLGADADDNESLEISIEEMADTLMESAERCVDGALRLAKMYGDVRRAHLEKADGLIPSLSGDIASEFEKLSAEYQNALSDSAADKSTYRMRYLNGFD